MSAILWAGRVIVTLFITFECIGRVVNWRGVRTTVAQCGELIDVIMRTGYRFAVLRLRDEKCRRRHIRFQKFMSRGKPTRFVIIVPRKACTKAEFRRAYQLLTMRGHQPRYEVPYSYLFMKGLVVECGYNLKEVNEVARCVLIDAFGLDWDSPLRACPSGRTALDMNAVIGWDSEQVDAHDDGDYTDDARDPDSQ